MFKNIAQEVLKEGEGLEKTGFLKDGGLERQRGLERQGGLEKMGGLEKKKKENIIFLLEEYFVLLHFLRGLVFINIAPGLYPPPLENEKKKILISFLKKKKNKIISPSSFS